MLKSLRKFRKTLVVLAAISLSAVSPISIASERDNRGVFSDVDCEQTFGSAVKLTQLTVLSNQEMKETQGTQGPIGAFIGGAGGALEYTFHQQIGGNEFSTVDFVRDVSFGAATGAVSPNPALTVWNANLAISRGITQGIADRVESQRLVNDRPQP
jgi:hypothetical protein